MRRFLLLLTMPLAGIFAFGEVIAYWGSRRGLDRGTTTGQREAIVVLGYRNAGSRANLVNRHRVHAAVRSISPEAQETFLVFCGGSVAGDISEAELMDAYARTALGYTGLSKLDTTSRTTWENICNAVPLIESADSIKIVSDSLHAERGRAYLRQLRPDLAARLVRASDYRFGELLWLKPMVAIVGLRKLARARRRPTGEDS